MGHRELPTDCPGFHGTAESCERPKKSGNWVTDPSGVRRTLEDLRQALEESGHCGHISLCNEEERDHMPEVFHSWLGSLPLLEDKPKTTQRAYSQGLRRIVSFVVDDEKERMPPSEFCATTLDQRCLTDVVRVMRASGQFSKSTLNQTIAAVRSFIDYCVDERRLDREVAPDTRRIRKISKLEVVQSDPEYYLPKEIQTLFEVARSEDNDSCRGVRWGVRDHAMCGFLAVLGLRASELLGANIDWISRERLVDGDDRATWVMHVLGKGRRTRRLPLSKELIRANELWQIDRVNRFGPTSSDSALFVTRDGTRFNYRRLLYWLRTLNNEAALRSRTLHALRHTAGVQLAAEGVPMNVIQGVLGHASIATAGIYTELAGGELIGVLRTSGANRLLKESLTKMTSNS